MRHPFLSPLTRVTKPSVCRFFAGWHGDPYIFDRRGVVSNLQFTGDDPIADKNVRSIVLEAPNSAATVPGRMDARKSPRAPANARSP